MLFRATIAFSVAISVSATPCVALVNSVPLLEADTLVRLSFAKDKAVCTGFFINPTTIVTAAHCLYSESKDLWLVSDLTVSSGTDLSLQVEKIVPHPLYNFGKSSGHDVGIIKTSAFASKNTIFELSSALPDVLGKAQIMGAGRIDLESGDYGRSKGTANFVSLGRYVYLLGKSKNSETPGDQVTVAPNDSGGPIIDLRSGKVFAISSQTTVGSTSGTFIPAISIGTLLSSEENQKFIQSEIAD